MREETGLKLLVACSETHAWTLQKAELAACRAQPYLLNAQDIHIPSNKPLALDRWC